MPSVTVASTIIALSSLLPLSQSQTQDAGLIIGGTITASWGEEYELLDSSSVSSITVHTSNARKATGLLPLSYINNGLNYSAVYGNAGSVIVGLDHVNNVAGDSDDVFEQCFGVTNLQKDEVEKGIWFVFNFTGTFEIYRVQIFFGTDYGPNFPDREDGSPDLPDGFGTNYVEPFMMDLKSGQRVSFENTFDWRNNLELNGVPVSDWTVWQNDDPSSKADTPLTDSITIIVGDDFGVVSNPSFRICEILIYGRFVTDAPTSQPTASPVAPTFQPTAAPSATPSAAPTLAPSSAPTEDACPNFDVTQPCCADEGGYAWVDYYYNKLNDSRIGRVDEGADACELVLSDTGCCASDLNPGSYELTWSSQELTCLDGTTPVGESANDNKPVCNIDLLTGVGSSTYAGLPGAGSLFAFDGAAQQCACEYTLDVCETRRELTCAGSNTPYEVDSELCGVSHFIGGDAAGTTVVSDLGPVIDNGAETCDCDYVADHCADDIAYRDNFEEPGTRDDGDNSTVNFIQNCCVDSELVFGNVTLDALDLTAYLELSANGAKWGCLDAQALCDGSNVPENLEMQEQWLAYVLNNGSFVTSTLCECLIVYDEQATYLPTQATTAPSMDPSMAPSSSPTPAPTVYNYNDFVDAVVTQPCGGEEVKCDESYFEGSSERVSVAGQTTFSNGSCACEYDVGRWAWSVPSDPGYLELADDVWTKVRDNVSWSNANETSLVQSIDASSGRRRLLDSTTLLQCYDAFVTECDAISECTDDAPFSSNLSYFLSAVGTTSASWDAWPIVSTESVEEVTVCHCYFVYYSCDTASPTTQPTAQPTTSTPTRAPTNLTTTITTTEEKNLAEQAQDLVTDNAIYSGAAAAGLCIILFCCCLLCLKKRQRNKKAAVENKDHIAYSPASTQENDNNTKHMAATAATTTDGGGGVTEMTGAVSSPVVPEYRDNGDGTYAITFSERPFGLQFKASKPDKKNLCIAGIKADSVASRVAEHVVVGSTMVALMDTAVENLGARVINKMFGGEFGQRLPLTITFRRPEETEEEALAEEVVQPVVVPAAPPVGMAAAEALVEEDAYVEAEDEYTVELQVRPFGISFGKNSDDKRNLFVNGLDEGGIGEAAGVVVGSKIVRIQSEECRDLGAKKIFKLITKKYGETLPLRITFQRPPEAEEEEEEEYVEVQSGGAAVEDAVAAEEEAEYEEVEAEQYEEADAQQEVAAEEEQYAEDDEEYEYYEE